MSSIPLQRCIKKAQEEGYEVGIVERYIPFPKPWGHRVDLFGLFDAIAIRSDVPGVLGIQACPSGNIAAHVDKTKAPEPARILAVWKAAGNRACIWGWSKKGPRGKVKHWTCREIVL